MWKSDRNVRIRDSGGRNEKCAGYSIHELQAIGRIPPRRSSG